MVITTNKLLIMRILLDFGHGADDYTRGKYSPPIESEDKTVYKGRFREGNFNRIVGNEIAKRLKELGYQVDIIVTEDKDITLQERVARVNKICAKHGAKNCILVSVHANAAGSGSAWASARGCCVYVARKSSQMSKDLAKYIYNAADVTGFKGNRAVPKERYWSADFYIIKNTKCPAVLTENLFYDNKEDLAILMSEEGRKKIVDYHIAGILNFLGKK